MKFWYFVIWYRDSASEKLHSRFFLHPGYKKQGRPNPLTARTGRGTFACSCLQVASYYYINGLNLLRMRLDVEKRESGLEGFRRGGIQEKRDTGKEGYWKRGIQEAGQEGCRAEGKQGRREAGR